MIVSAAVMRVDGNITQQLQEKLELAASANASGNLSAAISSKGGAGGSIKENLSVSVKAALAAYDRVIMVGVVDF
jgi:hypothetical protein